MRKSETILNSLNLGEKIKQRRTEMKMTQDEFANRLEMGRSTITSIETRGNAITFDLLVNIAEALECDLSYFLKPSQYNWMASVAEPAYKITVESEKQISSVRFQDPEELIKNLDAFTKDFYYNIINSIERNTKKRHLQVFLNELENLIELEGQSLSVNEIRHYFELLEDAEEQRWSHL